MAMEINEVVTLYGRLLAHLAEVEKTPPACTCGGCGDDDRLVRLAAVKLRVQLEAHKPTAYLPNGSPHAETCREDGEDHPCETVRAIARALDVPIEGDQLMAGKTIAEMTAEVRECNEAHGWREGTNTFGDYIALLHSEASEALEAYRDHKVADATRPVQLNCPDPQCGDSTWDHDCKVGTTAPGKPEGVGSELADVLIRLLDMADVYGLDLDFEYERKIAYNRTRPFKHGGRAL